jgi:CRP/FNR family cyclic AMP-dependent transcriptional regulator
VRQPIALSETVCRESVQRLKRRSDAKAFLTSPGMARKVVDHQRATAIFSQGDSADAVLYIQHGTVKLTVLSQTGKEAVVGMLGRRLLR